MKSEDLVQERSDGEEAVAVDDYCRQHHVAFTLFSTNFSELVYFCGLLYE